MERCKVEYKELEMYGEELVLINGEYYVKDEYNDTMDMLGALEYDGFEYLDVLEFDDDIINESFETPMDALRAASFGRVNFSDEYFRFDGYGNIETLSQYDYDKEIEDVWQEIEVAWYEQYGEVADLDELKADWIECGGEG
jgi:hypothetical protein